jgi:serine protease AprX
MTKPATKTRFTAWAFVVLVTLAVGPPLWAQGSNSDHRVKQDEVVRKAVAEGRSVRAIVRFWNKAARDRGAAIVSDHGGRVHRALADFNALTVEIDPVTAHQLSADSGTVTISVDATVRSTANPAAFTGARTSGAKAAREQFRRNGHGISVAIIDSGVQPHADLPASRIRKFVDFVSGYSTPYDDFGHGTHVAGIIAGSGAVSWAVEDSYVGAAPGADIVALKVLDATGAGRTSDVIAALEWVARNHRQYNIRVVNLSLGHPVYEPPATDPLVQAAEALVRSGIVVVASAGNLGIDPRDNQVGNGGVTSPANGPAIIAVGAVNNQGTLSRGDDEVASYSSRGPTRFDLIAKPDLVAPGHRVVSLAAPGSLLFENFPALHVRASGERVASYMTLSGTSMAAPLVSGTAALMFDSNPRLSAGTVRALLEFTAQRLPGAGVLAQGAGSLNALGAVRLARLVKAQVPTGNVWLRSKGGVPSPYDMLHGEVVPWAKNVIWADGVLLGDSAYVHMAAWNDQPGWGQEIGNIVWGQCVGDGCSRGTGDNIVWGECQGDGCDNIVWGQCDGDGCFNIVWGQDKLDNIVWGECQGEGCDNIVWGQEGDNIVWGECAGSGCDNIVWGQDGRALSYWASNTVWGFWDLSTNWTNVTRHSDNIVWGQDYLDNIVWGECVSDEGCDNIVWGENIVWGQSLRVLTLGGQQ